MARPSLRASLCATAKASTKRSASACSARFDVEAIERLTVDAAMAMIATTTSISIRVKPCSEIPRADVGIALLPPRFAVGAECEHIDLALYTGIQVLIGVAPGVRSEERGEGKEC